MRGVRVTLVAGLALAGLYDASHFDNAWQTAAAQFWRSAFCATDRCPSTRPGGGGVAARTRLRFLLDNLDAIAGVRSAIERDIIAACPTVDSDLDAGSLAAALDETWARFAAPAGPPCTDIVPGLGTARQAAADLLDAAALFLPAVSAGLSCDDLLRDSVNSVIRGESAVRSESGRLAAVLTKE